MIHPMLHPLHILGRIIICALIIEGFITSPTLPLSHSAATIRRSTILQDSKSSSIETIQSLEAALSANNIQVRLGAIQELLNQRNWIYPSERIAKLRKRLNEDQLYSIFNSNHHLKSATGLFEFIRDQESCVLYGHKAQGKTQFLFFVFRLLQAVGEKVIFLDKSMLPVEFNNKIDINMVDFCGNWWKESFLQIGGDVHDTLVKFYRETTQESFGDFLFSLVQYARTTEVRIWIIIDEVVLYEKFPIRLPEEQNMGPFNWIITGSAEIGSWVAERHLEKLVFDLPLFTKDESTKFAANLCRSLDINLESTIGVPTDGVNDWLEEHFGGVVGYIAEMLLEVSKGQSVSQYISSLDNRMNQLIHESVKKNSISKEALAKDWLNEIKSRSNNWLSLRDAGLCGRFAPRGIIFALILNWLYTYYPGEDALSLVTLFRTRFEGDPGLDGCLLELEEILKLKASRSMVASLFKLNNREWIVDTTITLPTTGSSLDVFMYDESQSKLLPTLHSTGSSWNLIEVSRGFDVIDVVLVQSAIGSLAIYGIQITRSPRPFAKHHTFDTCAPSSGEKLEKLWNTICQHFKPDKQSVKKFFVMLAPNCEKYEHRPPTGHSSDYYFSPWSILPKDDTPTSKMRSRRSTKKEKG